MAARRVRLWIVASMAALIAPLHISPAVACDWTDPLTGTSSVCACGGSPRPVAFYDGWGYPRSSEVCTYNAECFPWPSGNGRYLLFASINLSGPPHPEHQGAWDIYISEWNAEEQHWGTPVNPGIAINSADSERGPCCTFACDTLYFDRRDDIYMSTWNGRGWTEARPLDWPVNTGDCERHPAISADGRRLYFTSDRAGSVGGLDIWMAQRSGAVWDSVVNLGPPINTPNEETRAFESADRQRLYFSNNHGRPRPGGSYGGASDVYVSHWDGSGWGPVGLVAAPINNDLIACSPRESPDGTELWIGSEAWEGGRGDEDIWVAERGVVFPPHPTQGYGDWVKMGELENAIYVYDLREDDQGVIFAATACAGETPAGRVFRTLDGGDFWIPCGDLPGAMVVYSLLVADEELYAGTYPLGDVFKSVDGGVSWVNTADLPEVTSARSLVRLANGDILVGTSPYNAALRNRIFRTPDGGLSWIEVTALHDLNPCKFIHQTSGGKIFAGGWGIDDSTKIHWSVDDGSTWDSVTVIPQWECEWTADAFCEAADGDLYLTGWNPSQYPGLGGGYVCKSGDSGQTWEMCPKIMRGDGVHSGRIYSIVEDLLGTLYVGMQPAPDSVVFASDDGGETWYSTGGLDGANECLCLLRSWDGAVYAGTTPNGDVFRYAPQSGVEPEPRADATGPGRFVAFANPCLAGAAVRFFVGRAGPVRIRIFDALGQEVRTLIDTRLEPGWHQTRFDGKDHRNRRLGSGLYFCRMESGCSSVQRKMVFLR